MILIHVLERSAVHLNSDDFAVCTSLRSAGALLLLGVVSTVYLAVVK